MAKNIKWQDDYWLLLMQTFLKEPVGTKPLYSRDMVSLALELHIPPQSLQVRMKQLARLDTPRIERIWVSYSNNPKRLARAVRLLREMKGFGHASEFYDGVETNATWEKDWMPVDGQQLTPVMLTMVLDLYFRLTPATMVVETPEVQELAKLMKVCTAGVVDALQTYQCCDPYLRSASGRLAAMSRQTAVAALLPHCQTIWQRYGNGDTEELAALADELKEYFV